MALVSKDESDINAEYFELRLKVCDYYKMTIEKFESLPLEHKKCLVIGRGVKEFCFKIDELYRQILNSGNGVEK